MVLEEKKLLCHLCLHIWSGRFFTFPRTLRLCFMVRNLEKLLAVPMVIMKYLPVESFYNWNRITQGMYKNRVNIDRNIFEFPTIKSSQRENPEWEISNNVYNFDSLFSVVLYPVFYLCRYSWKIRVHIA